MRRIKLYVYFISTCAFLYFLDIPWLMFPGLALIGVGGMPLIMTDVQVNYVLQNLSSYISL